jgi:hypothetical protein
MIKKEELFGYPVRIEKFNSNNSWGFGGAIGKRYHLSDKLFICEATAYYRHLPSNEFSTFTYDGVRLIDEGGTIHKNRKKLQVWVSAIMEGSIIVEKISETRTIYLLPEE